MKLCFQILCLMSFILTYLSADDKFVFLPLKPPPPCPPFEMYKICLSNCSNCEQRGNCIPSNCDQSGCDCLPHFVRLTPGGPCEPIHKCPISKCGENEVFRECGPICERCDSLDCRVINCEHKCYCKEGFKRDVNGKCIPMDECPQKECTLQEELRDSGPEDEYCLHADHEKDYGAKQNKTKCYCKDGLLRNSLGHCMDENFCSLIKCLRHEVYQPCVKKCNTTCRTYGDPNCKEDDQMLSRVLLSRRAF
uniref:Putative scavenger receptor cysteine-rich protein n=1 Tax=Latrodectus hesperus TaxID=256737 RepID=E7D1Y7_LATHE|nr:putative scavenger receptor cysteine-rich protein [Latrodectus hesperus]